MPLLQNGGEYQHVLEKKMEKKKIFLLLIPSLSLQILQIQLSC